MERILKSFVLLFIMFVASSSNVNAMRVIADSNKTKILATFEIESFNVSKDGMVSWTAINEQGSLPYMVEQFIHDQWVEVGRVKGIGTSGSNSYSVTVVFNSGENKFRVRQQGENKVSKYSKSIVYTSKKEPVKYELKDKNKTIVFSNDTFYIIYNPYGSIVKKGIGVSVDITKYPKGKYTLIYDNKVGNFER